MQRAYERAVPLLTEALALHRSRNGQLGIAWCLEGLAAVASAVGQAERAARYLGAAEMLRENIGAPLPPADRDGYDGAVAIVRAALGSAAFTAAWEAGRALPLEHAIGEALTQPMCGMT